MHKLKLSCHVKTFPFPFNNKPEYTARCASTQYTLQYSSTMFIFICQYDHISNVQTSMQLA